CLFEILLFPTDHEGQCALICAFSSTRYGCVQCPVSCCSCQFCCTNRIIDRDGGRIDKQGVRFGCFQQIVLVCLQHVFSCWEHGDHHICALNGLSSGLCGLHIVFSNCLGSAFDDIVTGYLITGGR